MNKINIGFHVDTRKMRLQLALERCYGSIAENVVSIMAGMLEFSRISYLAEVEFSLTSSQRKCLRTSRYSASSVPTFGNINSCLQIVLLDGIKIEIRGNL